MPRSAKKPPDLFDILAGFPSTANYTAHDLYVDFRKVFFGSDEGKRVLKNILELGLVFTEPEIASPIDPYLLAQMRGRRWMALKILKLSQFEPKEAPTRTRNRPE